MSQAKNDDIVYDEAKSSISDLWKKEDYWAIWIGFAFMLFGFIYFVNGFQTEYTQKVKELQHTIDTEKTKPYQTIALINAEKAKSSLRVNNEAGPKAILGLFTMPGKWSINPLDSVFQSQSAADAKNASKIAEVNDLKAAMNKALSNAEHYEEIAQLSNYSDSADNRNAQNAVQAWVKAEKDYSSANGKLAKAYNLIPNLVILGFVFLGIFSIGGFCMGYNLPKFAVGFLGIYWLTIFAVIVGRQADWSAFGINAEVCSIAVGMLIANTVGTPKFIRPALQVEYYIKTGLVCLGAGVIFNKLLAIGVPGIFVAWIVTPVVLVTTYIFGQKVLKIESKTLNMVVSSDMSVCGTSAAIAAASACRAKKEELTIAVGLSLTFTAIMMIVIPAIANAVGMPEILAGAWIGGTVDSTGAVAAAGALIGPKAMQVAATIKMIQNILIGVTAFFIALYWATKVDVVEGKKVSVMEIWHRFPKFVIGFLIASVICSLLCEGLENHEGVNLASALFNNGLLKITGAMQGWCFVLAFLVIGLSTNFRELAVYFKGGKPIILYVCGQCFNLTLTLIMAYIMFYLVFPEITANI